MKQIKTPTQPRHDDPKIDRAITDHKATIDKVAERPGVNMVVLAGIELADGVETPVPHKLDKAPSAVWCSAVRGPTTVGMIEEVGSRTNKYVTLKASGYGATVTVDVLVVP